MMLILVIRIAKMMQNILLIVVLVALKSCYNVNPAVLSALRVSVVPVEQRDFFFGSRSAGRRRADVGAPDKSGGRPDVGWPPSGRRRPFHWDMTNLRRHFVVRVCIYIYL